MKIVQMFRGVLIVGTLVHAGGDFQVVSEYESNDASLAEEAYKTSYADEVVSFKNETFIEQVEDNIKQSYVAVGDGEEDAYHEPTVEGYTDLVTVEEESIITSSSNLGDAINVYNASEYIPNTNNGNGISQQSSTLTKATNSTSSGVNNTKSSTIPLNLNAKNGFYVGLGITALNYDIQCDCPNKSAKETVVGGMTKIGYNLNKFIGIEARAMKINLKNGRGDITHTGLFLKPMLPLGPVASAYSLVGVAQTKSSGEIREINTKNLALGAGMEFGSGKGVGGFVDYERLIVKSGAPTLDTVTTGVTFGF